MLPPDFKPDQSVFADSSKTAEGDDDSDFDEYEGDGIPTVALIPSSMEANLSHGGKPVISSCLTKDANFLADTSSWQKNIPVIIKPR